MKNRSIIIAGASGLVGQALSRAFQEQGFRVYGLSTRPERLRNVPFTPIGWSPDLHPESKDESDEAINAFREASLVINLAGHSIGDGRLSKTHKAKILESRVAATRTLAHGLRHSKQEGVRWLQASAVGYYGDTGEKDNPEGSSIGSLFLSSVCQAWEDEATRALEALPQVSLAILRLGVVLSPDADAWKKMVLPIRMGAGGPLGTGKQWMSWIAKPDLVRMFLALAESDEVGIWNATAPEPVQQFEMVKALGIALSRPTILPTPAWALKMALGQLAEELVLCSCKAKPRRFQEGAFPFEYPEFVRALPYLLGD